MDGKGGSASSGFDVGEVIKAMSKLCAIAIYDSAGRAEYANQNFLAMFGFDESEFIGMHHRDIFKEGDSDKQSYRIVADEFEEGGRNSEYVRLGGDGHLAWIHSSYASIPGEGRNPAKILHIASDISESKRDATKHTARLSALARSQLIIDFSPNGMILDANDNFLSAFGYRLEEIKGKHHAMFCTRDHAQSEGYKDFWRRLNSGVFDVGEYMRVGKGGIARWLQATYNPVLDDAGKPVRIVKVAIDVTNEHLARERVVEVERELAEQMRCRAEELEAAMFELSDLMREMRQIAEMTDELAGTTAVKMERYAGGKGVQRLASEVKKLASCAREASLRASILVPPQSRYFGQDVA